MRRFFIIIPAFVCFSLLCAGQGAVIKKESIKPADTLAMLRPYFLGPGDQVEAFFSVAPFLSEDGSYVIERNDELDVRFVSNPELNSSVTVLPDGSVVVPPKGGIAAAGKTVKQLAEDLELLFKDELSDPVLFILPTRYCMTTNAAIRSLPSTSGPLSLRVQPDGFIALPLADTVMAAGLSVSALQVAAREKYRREYPNLSVHFSLAQPLNNLVYVLGEVRQPGSYPLDARLTLTQVLAKAGVMFDAAAMNSIVILGRTPDRRPVRRIVNVRAIIGKGTAADDIPLNQYDVVFVPKTAIAKIDLFVQQYINGLIPQIFRFGLGWNVNLSND